MAAKSGKDLAPEERKAHISYNADKDGHFRRQVSSFRDFISKDGRFPPEKKRYYLYVSYGCPWAHRTMIVRKLKGLEEVIPISVVQPYIGNESWSWLAPEGHDADIPGVIPDPLYGFTHLKQLYFKAEPNYSARFTVPVLWDSKEETIVSNESSEIIRMFNHEFDEFIAEDKRGVDFYPQSLRADIDAANEWIYHTINNGVYKSGFASTQAAYEGNVLPLFESLDRVEKMLEGKKYLIGDTFTEADIRLYTTIARFDAAYVSIFKCNIRTIRHGYPNIHRWLRHLYWEIPAFTETTNFQHIKMLYFGGMISINPTSIIPVGPLPHILPVDEK